MTKFCFKCNQDLPLSEFWKDKHQPNGLRAYCKTCEKAKRELWRKDNLGKNQAYVAGYRQRNIAKGKCRVCSQDALPKKRVCRKHYVIDVASKTLGVASLSVANELLKRFDDKPFCPYTNEPLTLGVNAHLDHILSLKNRPDLRRDINNVEWISETANLSKNGFNKNDFIEFCKLVAKNYG